MKHLLRTLLLCSLTYLVSCGVEDEPLRFPTLDAWQAVRPLAPGFELLTEDSREITEGSIELTFDVREGMTSLEISAVTSPDLWLQVTSIRGPSGERHVDSPDRMAEGYEFLEAVSADSFTLAGRGSGSFRYPNDATTSLEPGPWSITLSTFEVERDERAFTRTRVPAPVHARVSARSDTLVEGVIHLHIALGPETGLTADSAPQNESLMRALDAVEDIFMQQNIALGDVVFEDTPSLPENVVLERRTCDVTRVFPEVGRHVHVEPGYIPVAIIRNFSCLVIEDSREIDVGPLLYGYSPGIPGEYVSNGAALVVSITNMERRPDLWTQVLAHELGHFLGLLHIVGNGFEDNLDDTGESETNLMFPFASAEAAFITEQQGFVMRQSPYVQPL